MPRKHKHVLGTPYRRNYDPQWMENALRDVCDLNYSFSQAADRNGVPKATLYRKYRGLHGDKLGRPPAISEIEEKSIVTALLVAADFNFPFTRSTLKEFIQQYLNRKGNRVQHFIDNRPGDDWCEYFLKRNPELAHRNAQNMKRCRADVTKEVIQEYFENLRETIKDVPPGNIINYDETNITDDPGNVKVFARRGSKRVHRIIDFSKNATSIMFAVSADGTVLPIYVVYKAKYLYPNWIEGGPEGARYNRTASGWFDCDTFEDWFFSVALPYLKKKEGKKVIIGDNLGSHLSYIVLKSCQENNIAFVFLPKNSTHLCQPLDVAVFGPLKKTWKQILTNWKLRHKGVVPKTELPSLLKQLINESSENMKHNGIAGFEATGITPFNPDRVLNKITPRYDDGPDNNNELRESFTQIIQDVTRTEERSSRTRRTKITVPAGKSVSTVDMETPSCSSNNIDVEHSNVKKTNSTKETRILKLGQRKRKYSISESEDEASTVSKIDSESSENEEIHEIKTVVKNICDISEGCYIVVSYIYNEKTKKECTKEYLAKVTKLKKRNIEVSCLRPYKGKKSAFIFPTVEDISVITFSQIKYKVQNPNIIRGIHFFGQDVM